MLGGMAIIAMSGCRQPTLHSTALSNPDPAESIRFIDLGEDVDARDSDDRTPLHLAALLNSNPEVVTALIGAGADVNARNKYGKTPLFHAARERADPRVLEILIEAGADPLAKDDSAARTPFLEAAAHNEHSEEKIGDTHRSKPQRTVFCGILA